MNLGKYVVTQWQMKGREYDGVYGSHYADVTLKSIVEVPCVVHRPSELHLYVSLGADLRPYEEALRTRRIFELSLTETEEVIP